MEFLKKNWMKLVLVVSMTLVAVFALIAAITGMVAGGGELAGEMDMGMSEQSMMNGLIFLGITISALALVAFLVLKMLGKAQKVGSIALIAGGAAAVILVIVGAIMGAEFFTTLSDLRAEMNAMLAEIKYEDGEAAYNLASEAARPMFQMLNSMLFTQLGWIFVSLLTFGIVPLAFGLKKLLCGCNCSGKEEKAAE